MNSIFLLNEINYSQNIGEAHFNLWMVGEEPFLDVGLRLVQGQRVELYLPWDNATITDLYSVICDAKILNAIFNQHLTVTQTTGSGFSTVDRGSSKIDVVEIKDTTGCHASISNTANSKSYTKFTIESKKQTPNDSYVRLRARGFGKDVFSKKHEGTNSVVNPYREAIEAVDFRLNEMRTVTPADFGKPGLATPPIDKLHFFLLKGFHETNSLSSPPYDRCRELEDVAWKNYLPRNQASNEATLAYHWKKAVKDAEHFSVLSTFGEKRASKRILLVYVLAIVFINLLSNAIYDGIKATDSSSASTDKQQKTSQ